MPPGEPASLRAVRAVSGFAGNLRESEGQLVESDSGDAWYVRPIVLDTLAGHEPPGVLAVSSALMDPPRRATWAIDDGTGAFHSLMDVRALEQFAGSLQGLSGLGWATLVAVVLGPNGAERVMDSDDTVESLFQELAPRIPADQRPLDLDSNSEGWRLGFLSARLAAEGDDPIFRISARRWNVRFVDGRLDVSSRLIVDRAVLERYRAGT